MRVSTEVFCKLSVIVALIGALAAAAFICCIVLDIDIGAANPKENAADINPTDSGSSTHPTVAGADTTDAADIIDRYISGDLPIPDMNELEKIAEGLQAVRLEDRRCAVAYTNVAAWMFDYELMSVGKLADLDILLSYADPTGRAAIYFENAYIDYQIEESKNTVDIVCKVTSQNNSESVFTVNSYYCAPTDKDSDLNRGKLSYGSVDIAYPGSDEPISVDSIDELDKLCPEINPDSAFVKLVKAFVACDIPALEDMSGLGRGVLSCWEGMVISDYTINREMPLLEKGDYSLTFTLEKSNVERYPAGRYSLCNSETMLDAYEIVRLDSFADSKADSKADSEADGETNGYKLPDDANLDAVEQAYMWGLNHGGYLSEERQDPTDDVFAHLMLEYLLWIARVNGYGNDAFTGNDYREYAEKYLSLSGFENEYTRYGSRIINHGAHGGNSVYGEVTGYRYEDGIYYVTVSCYADPFKSVVAQVHEYAMKETDDGLYAVVGTRFIYESGLPKFVWCV